MKAKVGRWTAIQTCIPDTKEGNALWEKIERRTWGKHGYTVVNIAITKQEQPLMDIALAAIAEIDKKHGREVEMAG